MERKDLCTGSSTLDIQLYLFASQLYDIVFFYNSRVALPIRYDTSKPTITERLENRFSSKINELVLLY